MSARAPDTASGVAVDSTLLERVPDVRKAAPSPQRSRASLLGTLALAALVLCSLTLVVVAAGRVSNLVPRSHEDFPDWLAGPLHGIASPIALHDLGAGVFLSAVLVAMAIAYGVVLACAPALRARVAIGAIVALHAVWLLSPPMPLTDIFNYLGYARLGALHGLNPYTHGIVAAPHDAAYLLTTWHHLRSPYGPLFTLASYALAPLPLPVAYWVVKLAIVAASLGCIALLWRCARALDRAPVPPVLLYAVNPLVLVYGLGGFHNDVLMLLPVLGAVAFVLAGRDGRAGASAVIAVAVKVSAGVLAPFLLLGARRRGRFLTGAAAASALLLVASWAVFGLAPPNLADQSSLVTNFSVPNVVGHLMGLGGAPDWLLKLATAALVVAVAWLARRVWRGQMGWIEACGWATVALLLSLSWLVPWYVMWLLPFAGLAASTRLRRAALVLGVYLLLTFLPVSALLYSALGFHPLSAAAKAQLSALAR